MGATDSKDLDRINRMYRINSTTNPVHPVQIDASSGAAPDSVKKLLDFVSACLSAAPEESGVVSDLLAHPAEMNAVEASSPRTSHSGFSHHHMRRSVAHRNELSRLAAPA